MRTLAVTTWFEVVLVALTSTLGLSTGWAMSAQSRSVLDGVYSDAQAERGKTVYLVDCAQCHSDNLMGGEGATELVGSPFLGRWNGQTLGDLYVRVRETMPLGNPNTLSRRDYTDVVAYILSENEFPTGEQDLPQSLEALKAIRIASK
jgi:mono/diheme cytochrome c family protein